MVNMDHAQGLRVVELDARLLSGRLTGMLFADQGAEVVVLSSGMGGAGSGGPRLTDGDDTAEKRAGDMLDRNKIRPRNHTTEEGRRLLKGGDVIGLK